MLAFKRSAARLLIVGAWLCGFLAGPAEAQPAPGRTLVFISDLHLGVGKDRRGIWRNTEDFRWHADLEAFLAYLRATGKGRVDLVLVGDVFELWQSPFMECSADLSRTGCKIIDCRDDDTDLGCTEEETLRRLRHVLDQHDPAIKALDAFACEGENALHILPGNHDAALLFEGLRAELAARFKSSRISISRDGRWLSPDRKIVAEHGHQFDDVNKFAKWPAPFTGSAEGRHITRPWGENMVQRFYNQYEEALPVIDNLSSETAGIRFAVAAGGLKPTAQAIGKFLRFFVFESSLAQIGTALGEGKGGWDVALTRKKGPDFFLDVLSSDPQLGTALDPGKGETGGFDPARLSAEEINVICLAKHLIRERGKTEVRPCPTGDDHLGAAIKGLLFSVEDIQKDYLRGLRTELGSAPKVYVYGHTHRAHIARPFVVADPVAGDFRIAVINTGAFQRVATREQLERIAIERRKSRPDITIFDLRPEDLPPCYTFVRIEPYSENPAPTLHNWRLHAGATGFRESRGGCPPD